MRNYSKVFGFVALGALVGSNVFAAGYNCSTKRYVSCAAGYFLSSSKCVLCPDNSTTNANNKSTSCTCKDGFSLDGKSTGVKTTTTAACKAFDKAAEEKAKQFTVTYLCGSGSGSAPSSATATIDVNFTPAANTCTAPSGHSFEGWSVSGTSELKSAGTTFKWGYSENKTFTAKWLAPTVTQEEVSVEPTPEVPAETPVESAPEPQPTVVSEPQPVVATESQSVAVTAPEQKKVEVSKAEMISVGFSGVPCWQMSGTPKQYKECVHSVIAGRL